MISTEPLPSDPVTDASVAQLLILNNDRMSQKQKWVLGEEQYDHFPRLPEGWNVVWVNPSRERWLTWPVQKWESPITRLITQIEQLTFHKDVPLHQISEYVRAKHNVDTAATNTYTDLQKSFTIQVDTGNGLDRITFTYVEDSDTLRLKAQEAA